MHDTEHGKSDGGNQRPSQTRASDDQSDGRDLNMNEPHPYPDPDQYSRRQRRRNPLSKRSGTQHDVAFFITPYCVFSAVRVEWILERGREGRFTAMLYNVAQICRYPLGARHIVMESET